MKPFQFSLNTVLDVRSNEEQMARAVHAVAQEALEAILLQRRSVERTIESNLLACRQVYDEQVNSGTIARLQSALRELRVQLKAFEPEVKRLQDEADAKWQLLLQASQRREALDKLREKQHSAHLKEGSRT